MNDTRKTLWGRIKAFDYLPLIIAFALIVAFFGITTNHFLCGQKFPEYTAVCPKVGILSCTMTLILVSGGIDLSMGSVIALGGIVLGTCTLRGVPT